MVHVLHDSILEIERVPRYLLQFFLAQRRVFPFGRPYGFVADNERSAYILYFVFRRTVTLTVFRDILALPRANVSA
jgi:hypothetical protein